MQTAEDLKKKEDFQDQYMTPGEDLVVMGSIAKKGTRLLIEKRWELLRTRLSEHYLSEEAARREPSPKEVLQELLAGDYGVTAHCPVGEGGILTAVWDLTAGTEAGVRFWLRKIPVSQATIEICEICGCTPYRLWSEDCFLLATESGTRILELCKEQGIPADIIGYVKPGIAREIRHGEETGYLERPRADELYKILGEHEEDMSL